MTSSGQVAVLDTIRTTLHQAFPEMERPSRELVYDTLAQLMTDRKVKKKYRVKISIAILLYLLYDSRSSQDPNHLINYLLIISEFP